MQKQTKPIRVDATAHDRARAAGLCVSRIASKALIQAADALEGTTSKTKEPRESRQASPRDTTPRGGQENVSSST